MAFITFYRDNYPTHGIRQRFGNADINEFANQARMAIKIYHAVILGTAR